MENSERLVIFDTDGGTDDAWALLMLLRAEQKMVNMKILAITCVHGNTKLDNVERNVFRVLDTAERSDIPVFRGAKDSILPFADTENFHGKDGLGDVCSKEGYEDVSNRLQKKHAVTVMYELVKQYPNRVSLLLVGPLTNVALCMRMYPDFAENVKDIWIMGGNRRGIGNITTCAEFNFFADPEAAFVVLGEEKFDKIILPWETCVPKTDRTTLEWRFNTLGTVRNRITKLMDPIDKKVYEKSTTKSWSPCDAYLMACFLFPDLMIKRKATRHVSIELAGVHTRGQMIVDHVGRRKDNATIIELVDVPIYRQIALWTAGHDIKL